MENNENNGNNGIQNQIYCCAKTIMEIMELIIKI